MNQLSSNGLAGRPLALLGRHMLGILFFLGLSLFLFVPYLLKLCHYRADAPCFSLGGMFFILGLLALESLVSTLTNQRKQKSKPEKGPLCASIVFFWGVACVL